MQLIDPALHNTHRISICRYCWLNGASAPVLRNKMEQCGSLSHSYSTSDSISWIAFQGWCASSAWNHFSLVKELDFSLNKLWIDTGWTFFLLLKSLKEVSRTKESRCKTTDSMTRYPRAVMTCLTAEKSECLRPCLKESLSSHSVFTKASSHGASRLRSTPPPLKKQIMPQRSLTPKPS